MGEGIKKGIGKRKMIIIALSSLIVFLVAMVGIKYIQVETGIKSAIKKQYEDVGVEKIDKVKEEDRFDRIVHLSDDTKVPVVIYVSEDGGFIVDEVGLIDSDKFDRNIEGDYEGTDKELEDVNEEGLEGKSNEEIDNEDSIE